MNQSILYSKYKGWKPYLINEIKPGVNMGIVSRTMGFDPYRVSKVRPTY